MQSVDRIAVPTAYGTCHISILSQLSFVAIECNSQRGLLDHRLHDSLLVQTSGRLNQLKSMCCSNQRFAALTMKSVGKAAGEMVAEVKRQFSIKDPEQFKVTPEFLLIFETKRCKDVKGRKGSCQKSFAIELIVRG